MANNNSDKTNPSAPVSPDYSNAVGSLLLENSKNSSRIKRWSIFMIAFQLLGVALMSTAAFSVYGIYSNQKNIQQIRKDPLGDVVISGDKISPSAISFDQLDSSLRDKIIRITNATSTNTSTSTEASNITTGTLAVTSVGAGLGLTGGPITSAGALPVSAPTCADNERLSWSGAGFECEAVAAGISNAQGPIALNLNTGTVSCPTCLTSIGTALIASADTGISQNLNVGDTLALVGGHWRYDFDKSRKYYKHQPI